MSIAVNYNQEEEETTIVIDGRLDFSCHQEFRDAYSQNENAKSFTVDMSKTEYLDSSALGMLLLLATFSAIGLYLSSLTENQTIAAISTFGVLFMLWIIDWLGGSVSNGHSVLSYLSLLQHHHSMLEGVFNSSDIAYYLLLIVGFLVLTIRQLDRERLL